MDIIDTFIPGFSDQTKSVLRMDLRRQILKILAFAVTFMSAFLFWKFSMALTGSDSPGVVVLTQSMEPGFYRGDILFVVGPKNLRAGDIVVFQTAANDIPIVHRLMEIRETPNGRTYLTKGDNNKVNDRGLYSKDLWFLSEEHLQGKIVGYIPNLGYITIMISSTPTSRALAFALMGVYYIFSREEE
ncbi:Signal peptidase complex catalytic subunit S11C [Bonamia ostreae]|uniref:Signal peptidase complex catalytic subunit SEC11 n=1 Tax=Bonamia ostreae TaxID=126728 RepID=A0ABV2AMS9_9EUKA